MKSFSSKIILTFVILIIFIVLVISFFNVYNKQKVATRVMEENLANLIYEKKSILDLRIRQVELEVEDLAYSLKKYEEILPMDKVEYVRHPDGTYREYGDERSLSLFLSSNVRLNKEIEKQIFYTKELEEDFKRSVRKNSDIACTYSISKDGVLRVYPYMDEDQFDPDHDFRRDHYFENTIKNSQGQAQAIWTRPYYDWAGRGLVVTCAYPLMVNGQIEHVIFADVTLLSLQEEIADFNASDFGHSFLIDDKGDIIFHPDYISVQGEKGEELKKDIFSLSDDKDLHSINKKMLAGKSGQEYYYDKANNSKSLITFSPIEGTKWSLAYVINVDDYSIDIQDYLGIHFFGPLIIIMVFSLFIYLALRKLSRYLVDLSAQAEKLALGSPIPIEGVRGGNEIESIAKSLNTMNSNLTDYMNKLIQTNTKMETIFNSLSGVLFVIDRSFKVINVNSLGKDIIYKNYRSNSNGFCFEYFKGCAKACNTCVARKTFSTGQEGFQEIAKDGNIYHLKTYPIFDNKGEVHEVVVYSTIETERIMMEREFYQKEKLASIGQISAAITHELRSPIGIINGCNYLLKDIVEDGDMDKEDKAELLDIVREIDFSIQNSRKIINGLLDFSRDSSGDDQRVNIMLLLEQIFLLYKKNFAEYNINAVKEYKLDDLYIGGNPDSLRLVFINLIDNALYEMKGGGTLTIGIEPIDGEKSVEITVGDTGQGMDDESLKNIFKPFYTSKPGQAGTGIGMWLVKREVERNRGRIHIRSKLGQGTKISLIFPLEKKIKGGSNA